MKSLDDMISGLPAERRANIEERANVLIARQFAEQAALLLKETALRDLEDACALTAERIAELLGVGDVDGSRPEGEADISFSKLRDEIAAKGGSLDLVVRLPGKPPVFLSSLLNAEAKRRQPQRGSSDKPHATRLPV